MPFRYRIKPSHLGAHPYTTRPDLAPPLTEGEVIEELVHASAISEGDIRSVLSNLRRILVNAAQQTRPSEPLFGLFRMGLSSGGTVDDPEQSLSAADIGPSLNLYASSELQGQFQAGLTLDRTGIDTERLPELELVRNEASPTPNSYTPGDALRLTGHDLKLDPADATQGVFLKNAAGVETRATRYLTCTEGTLLVLVPAALTGPQTLLVRVNYGSGIRQATYNAPLAQA